MDDKDAFGRIPIYIFKYILSYLLTIRLTPNFTLLYTAYTFKNNIIIVFKYQHLLILIK